MAKTEPEVKTLVVDNFRGTLTYFPFGDINSGRGDIRVNAGANPFVRPGSLTWIEKVYQIDEAGDVITDLIMDGHERVESGILYVYCIGHTGRLYKIQVNDPNTFNPDYDNPVLLATLTSGSPTFTRGGFMQFFGATQRIYIGHDKGVTRIDFDGTNETAISGTWEQDVPRPLRQFVGKLYAGNGSNIAEIDSTGTVTSSTKLSPGFPTDSQVRDMDYSVDGNYLEMVLATLPLGDITSATPDTSISGATESYIFKWNGTDTGYTTFDYYPAFALDTNTTFQDSQYVFGRDQVGTGIFNPTQKFTQIPEMPMILPNAVGSFGNMLTWMGPLYFLGELWGQMYVWGNYDWEVGQPVGNWGLTIHHAVAPETDVVQIPFQKIVSTQAIGPSSNGYAGNQFGVAKVYFSSLETSSAPTTKYRLFKWRILTSPILAGTQPVVPPPPEEAPLYQTQTQMFSKRVVAKEVRIYSDPWVDGNSFEISLIGPDGEQLAGSVKVFDTADGTLTIGADYSWYNPKTKPTYAIGLRFMNLGSANFFVNKVEIDYAIGGE